MFPGNTNDASTLKGVLSDLKERFCVGRIALIADRGIISDANVSALGASGFDHVMATRLHLERDRRPGQGAPTRPGVPVPEARSGATEVVHDGWRYVVVFSPERFNRDNRRREEILAETEDALCASEERVRSGRLGDPAKIGAAAQRILSSSPMARVFVTHLREGAFAPFKVLKDFLGLRPVFHFSEARVRGHIAPCVIAAAIEALIAIDLERSGIMDPDLPHQVMTPRRALRELDRIRVHELSVGNAGSKWSPPQRAPGVHPLRHARRHRRLGPGRNSRPGSSADLASKDGHLVAQHKDLGVLRERVPPRQPKESEGAMDESIQEREHHGEQPRRLHPGRSRRWLGVSGPFRSRSACPGFLGVQASRLLRRGRRPRPSPWHARHDSERRPCRATQRRVSIAGAIARRSGDMQPGWRAATSSPTHGDQPESAG